MLNKSCTCFIIHGGLHHSGGQGPAIMYVSLHVCAHACICRMMCVCVAKFLATTQSLFKEDLKLRELQSGSATLSLLLLSFDFQRKSPEHLQRSAFTRIHWNIFPLNLDFCYLIAKIKHNKSAVEPCCERVADPLESLPLCSSSTDPQMLLSAHDRSHIALPSPSPAYEGPR